MLTRRAASPAVSTARARRNPTVRDFRDRIRPGSGLLTQRPYPTSRCRCGEYPAKSRQGVRPWQVAGVWMSVKGVFFAYPGRGVPACFGRSACSADGVRGCPRDPPSGRQRPRTYGGQRWRGECHSAAFTQVRGYVTGRRVAVCKTVGSAYVGSNPTPATTCENGPLAGNSRLSGPFLRCPVMCHRVALWTGVSRCLRTYSGRRPAARTVGVHRRLFHGQPRTGRAGRVFRLDMRR